MGLGILEDHHLDHVPGTAFVRDGDRKREAAQDVARNHLKYDKTGKILLVPQPSDDPNDPLVSRAASISALQQLQEFVLVWATDNDRTGPYGSAISS
jgi:hypothetical protein